MKVCVMGLGYVGGPLVTLIAKKGYEAFGYDINERRIALYKKDASPIEDEFILKELPKLHNKIIFSSNPKETVAKADVILICVPTPVTKKKEPDLSFLVSAVKTVRNYMKKRVMVIVESTIYPGTIEEICLPILSEKGVVGKDFFLGHCPERIDPCNVKHFTVENIPRVLGMVSNKGLEKAKQLYNSLLSASVITVGSVKSAEASKILENTFRDVNIALINEIALSFEKMGINTIEVIEASSTKPFSFMPHWPGCGVGGHCIPIDPYYMIQKAESLGFDHKMLKLARKINENMPIVTLQKILEGCKEAGIDPAKSTISMLGLSYKPNIKDLRESASLKILPLLKNRFKKVNVFDPHCPEKSTVDNLTDSIKSDVVLLVTSHSEFKNIRASHFVANNVKVVVDGRNFWNPAQIKSAGIIYRGIGRN